MRGRWRMRYMWMMRLRKDEVQVEDKAHIQD
jgi:hypothetical protein